MTRGDGTAASSPPGAPILVTAAVVGLVAAVLRALVFRDLYADDPLLRTAVLDDAAYLEMAQSIAAGEDRAWFLAPLHPWIVARLSVVFPLGLRLLGATNLVLGAATSALVAVVASRLAGRAAGWIAGLCHAVLAVFVFHDVLPGQEPALGLLYAAALLAALALHAHGRPRDAFLLGLCAGIAVLGRGTSFALLLAVVPGWRAAPRRGVVALACGAGLLLALAPATVRNAIVTGDATPLPWSGGPNLYLGNGPDARETVSMMSTELGADPQTIEERAWTLAARAGPGRELTGSRASRWWVVRTWDERGDVAGIAGHLGRKALLFWSAEERGSSHDLRAEREFSAWLGFTPGGGYWLLCLGAGAWWLLRRRRPATDAAALAAAGTWALLTLFFPLARYRLPVEVLCAALVGAALVRVPGVWREDRRRVLVAAALVVLGGAVAHIPLREADAGVAYANVGGAFAQEGDLRQAKEWAQRALDVSPKSGPAHQMLGRLALAGGDAGSALYHFSAAAMDRRTRYSAQVAALPALLMTGRLGEAQRAARGLLGERPNDPLLLAYAAAVAHASGNERQAAAWISAALALAPRHPEIQRVAAILSR